MDQKDNLATGSYSLSRLRADVFGMSEVNPVSDGLAVIRLRTARGIQRQLLSGLESGFNCYRVEGDGFEGTKDDLFLVNAFDEDLAVASSTASQVGDARGFRASGDSSFPVDISTPRKVEWNFARGPRIMPCSFPK